MKLDLGGGLDPQPGYISVDLSFYDPCEMKVICDFERGLSFKGQSIEEIRAHHTLEHIHNLRLLLNECWRVLKPLCQLHITVPAYPHTNAFIDPTHVRYFVMGTFTYFSYHLKHCLAYGFKPWIITQISQSDDWVISCSMMPYDSEVKQLIESEVWKTSTYDV